MAIGRKAEPVIEEVLVEELRRLWAEAAGRRTRCLWSAAGTTSYPWAHSLTGARFKGLG